MDWWMWIVGGLLLLVLEISVPGGIILLFFGAAALVVGTLLGIGVEAPVWLQLALFSIISVLSLVTLRGPILQRLKGESDLKPIDSLLGTTAIVMEEAPAGARGKAELRGATWTILNLGNEPLTPGQACVVERVEGLRLYVRGVQ
jgi:membrane protein implicated in regulation of membrane protease activity